MWYENNYKNYIIKIVFNKKVIKFSIKFIKKILKCKLNKHLIINLKIIDYMFHLHKSINANISYNHAFFKEISNFP